MITVRPSAERGRADYGWLDTRYTFSFSDYYDPAHMGFRSLRVINEDRVAPGRGFGMHHHRDMEIITVVLRGTLAHRDSLGNEARILPGEVQCMTAGTGIEHSEFNPSPKEIVHLYQIWILPEKRGLKPGYSQRTFDLDAQRGQLTLLVSSDGRDGSLRIHQDAALWMGRFTEGQKVDFPLSPGRHAYVQAVRGEFDLNASLLQAGDGAAISEESQLVLSATEDSEVMVFDLA